MPNVLYSLLIFYKKKYTLLRGKTIQIEPAPIQYQMKTGIEEAKMIVL
jgi:hypothetical protein